MTTPRDRRGRTLLFVALALLLVMIVVSLMVGAYLGQLVLRGDVEPDWLDRSLEMLWTLMVQPGPGD